MILSNLFLAGKRQREATRRRLSLESVGHPCFFSVLRSFSAWYSSVASGAAGRFIVFRRATLLTIDVSRALVLYCYVSNHFYTIERMAVAEAAGGPTSHDIDDTDETGNAHSTFRFASYSPYTWTTGTALEGTARQMGVIRVHFTPSFTVVEIEHRSQLERGVNRMEIVA